jgi:hypothetical protein
MAPGTTATIYGSPGARPRGLGLLKSLWPISLILFAMGYLTRAAVPHPAIPQWGIAALFFVVGVCMAATVNKARTKMANHAKGARGEERAARTLASLPPECSVFHGVMLKGRLRDLEGGADIDHVVITPAGLFAIETKHWHGHITCEDGQLLQDGFLPDRDPLEQARSAAQRVQTFLQSAGIGNTSVTPILLFTADAPRNVPETIQNVIVMDLQTLNRRLLHNRTNTIIPRALHQQIAEQFARQVEP